MVRSFLSRKLARHGGLAGLVRAAFGRRPPPASPAAPPPAAVALPAPDADGFVAVAASARLVAGRPVQAEVNGATVAVYRVDAAVFAVDNACLHEDGPLGEGRQDGFVATCPYHDWRYDVRDGSCLTRKSRRLATYAARERDGFVWVGPRRTPGSEGRGGEHADGLVTRRAD